MNNVTLYYTYPNKFYRRELADTRVPLTPRQRNTIDYKTRQRKRSGQGIPTQIHPCHIDLIIEGHEKCNLGVGGTQAKANSPDPTEHFSEENFLCKTHYDEVVSLRGGRRTRKKIDRSLTRKRKSNVKHRLF